MIEYLNECDKLRVSVPKKYVKGHIDFCLQGKFLGGNYRIFGENIIFEISGKLFYSPTDLGAITKDNIEQIPEIIREQTGMKIDISYFLEHAILCRFDIKKDILVKDNPTYYLSEMREIFKSTTNKYNVHSYGDLKYETGLTLIPKAKSTKHRFSIYDKGVELKKSRSKHPEYNDQFEYFFLEDVKRTVRCEYQSLSFSDMREVLKLPRNKKPAISDVFEYRTDIIREQFAKLIA